MTIRRFSGGDSQQGSSHNTGRESSPIGKQDAKVAHGKCYILEFLIELGHYGSHTYETKSTLHIILFILVVAGRGVEVAIPTPESTYARGFRNPYDITWDGFGQLWATDNSPDFDPPEPLHRVMPGGIHGYPYYECDVCFSPPVGVTVIPPMVTFAPSSSPTGVTSYLADQLPGYRNSLFVTLWSSFPGAQKVMHIGAGGSAPVNFATGFTSSIDVTVGPDGSLYVADWATGIIFKKSYTG